MTGIVEHWNEDRNCGAVVADKTRFITFRQHVADDEIGRKFLIRGESVTFDTGNDRKGRECAVNVKPLHRAPVDAGSGEYCVVCLDTRLAQRPLGGRVYLGGAAEFKPHNVILVTKFCKPHREGDCWRAGDAQFIAHTQDEFEAMQCSSR